VLIHAELDTRLGGKVLSPRVSSVSPKKEVSALLLGASMLLTRLRVSKTFKTDFLSSPYLFKKSVNSNPISTYTDKEMCPLVMCHLLK
jgi:hypothetical protein